jgi:hypothetical protein
MGYIIIPVVIVAFYCLLFFLCRMETDCGEMEKNHIYQQQKRSTLLSVDEVGKH